MKKTQRWVVVVNDSKNGAVEIGARVAHLAAQARVEVALCREYPVPADFLKNCDLCCVVGGDGTLLSVVNEAVRHDVPVFGINRGTLGFLATYDVATLDAHLAHILNGEYVLDRRAVLQLNLDGEVFYALNDIVIKQHAFAKLIKLNVHADGEFVNTYGCDGIILATPTGSTAYNLSAGGPIMCPRVDAVSVTPICPHTLSNRTVMFSGRTQLSVDCAHECSGAHLAIDGRIYKQNCDFFPLNVRVADKPFLLVRSPAKTYFSILKNKLGW